MPQPQGLLTLLERPNQTILGVERAGHDLAKVQRESGPLLTPEVLWALGGGLIGPRTPRKLTLSPSYSTLQLDADDAKPTFDEEEGRDEYNEVTMPL